MDQGRREKKLAINTLILSIGTIFSSIFSFFVIPIYSKWLSATDYGLYDLFVTYVSLLQPVLTLSCGEACFRFLLEKEEEKDKKNIISNSIMISFVGLIIGAIIFLILFLFNGQRYLFPFTCLLFSSTLFLQCEYITRGIRRLMVYTVSNIVYMITMAVSVTIFVYFKGMGVAGILFGSAIGYCCGCIYSVFTCKIWNYFTCFAMDVNIMWEMIKYSAPLIPNTISWWIVGVSDRSLVSLFLGPAVNGVYAIASKMPSLCSSFLGVFHKSWLESASDAVNDNDRNIYFNRVFNQIGLLCLSICMCVLSINRYMYRWIWDSKYIAGYYHVSILITAAVFSCLAQFIGGIEIALKKTKANGTTTIIAALINIIVNFSCIKWIGLYAASLSTLVSYVVLFFVRLFFIRKEFSIKFEKKLVLAVILYIVVIISQYIMNEIIGIGTILYSIAVSLLLNQNLVLGLLNKIVKRKG